MSGANRSRGPELALVNPWRMTKLPRFGLESTEERVLKRARTKAALPMVMPGGNQSSPALPYSLKAIEIRTPQKRPYFSFTSNSKIRGKAY